MTSHVRPGPLEGVIEEGRVLVVEEQGERLGWLRCRFVLTSTQVDEDAQQFYRKRGYADCGALNLPGQAAELFLRKSLDESEVSRVAPTTDPGRMGEP